MRRDSMNRPLKESSKTSKMTSSRSIANRRIKINKVWVAFAVFGAISILRPASGRIVKRSYSDQSVRGYLTERTCWWNEVCKEEFQQLFRCRCPQWSYCRSPGRYYNAYCSMTNTGYIWTQPTWDWETA